MTTRSSAPNPDEVQLVWAPVTPINEIPARRWLYGRFLLLGAASVIGAQDGAGKGFIAAATILTLITGRDILHEKVWVSGKVAIITYEDDVDEWRRRIAAACLYHGCDYETIITNVAFFAKEHGRVTLARQEKIGLVHPDSERIIHFLKREGFVALIIDPFNSAHEILEGNNNVAIAAVAMEATRIAQQADVGVLVLHHLRKGNVGNVDDLMGATSLRANFRSCRILVRMTDEEARQLGLTDGSWRYLRIAGSKENYAPPPDQATWFKLETIALGNPHGIYTDGDSMAAARRFEPPPAFEGMSYPQLGDVFHALRQPHARNPKAQDIPWVGRPLIDVGKRTEAQAKTIIKNWLKNGVLIDGEPVKSEKREPIKTIVVNPAKVAEIMAGHSWQRAPSTSGRCRWRG
jgi:hypothetical protein